MQLRLNKAWVCIYSLMAALVTTLFFIWATAVLGYLKLNAQTLGKVESFALRQLKENAYGIEAIYTYTVSGKEYQSKKVLTNPIFLNEYAAKSHLQKYWKAQEWPVWYCSNKPENSALQKLFPIKKFFSFFLSLCVLLYFVWLKKYAEKQAV